MDKFTKEMLGHLPMDKIETFHRTGECLFGMRTPDGHEVITKYRIVEDDRKKADIYPIQKVTSTETFKQLEKEARSRIKCSLKKKE